MNTNVTYYFNEELHKYYDSNGRVYTSVTTLIHKYSRQFDADYWALYRTLKGSFSVKPDMTCKTITVEGVVYKKEQLIKIIGKRAINEIKANWKTIALEATTFGTEVHNKFETSLDNSLSDKTTQKDFNPEQNPLEERRIANKLVAENHIRNHITGDMSSKDRVVKHLGKVVLVARELMTKVSLIKDSVISSYPTVLDYLTELISLGFTLFSEVRMYDEEYTLSGTSDIVAINDVTKQFMIIDWKTNKYIIRFESGYYYKHDLPDGTRVLTDEYILTNNYFLPPLAHLPYSLGNEQSLQLSSYAYMIEKHTGMSCIGISVIHLRKNATLAVRIPGPKKQYEVIEGDNSIKSVTIIPMRYLNDEVQRMFNHHRNTTDLNGVFVRGSIKGGDRNPGLRRRADK